MRLPLLFAALALFAVGCAEEPAPVDTTLGEAEVVTEPTDDVLDDDLLDDSLGTDDLVVDDSTLIDGAIGDDPGADL